MTWRWLISAAIISHVILLFAGCISQSSVLQGRWYRFNSKPVYRGESRGWTQPNCLGSDYVDFVGGSLIESGKEYALPYEVVDRSDSTIVIELNYSGVTAKGGLVRRPIAFVGSDRIRFAGVEYGRADSYETCD